MIQDCPGASTFQLKAALGLQDGSRRNAALAREYLTSNVEILTDTDGFSAVCFRPDENRLCSSGIDQGFHISVVKGLLCIAHDASRVLQ